MQRARPDRPRRLAGYFQAVMRQGCDILRSGGGGGGGSSGGGEGVFGTQRGANDDDDASVTPADTGRERAAARGEASLAGGLVLCPGHVPARVLDMGDGCSEEEEEQEEEEVVEVEVEEVVVEEQEEEERSSEASPLSDDFVTLVLLPLLQALPPPISAPHLPYIPSISPRYLPYISPISRCRSSRRYRLLLPYISLPLLQALPPPSLIDPVTAKAALALASANEAPDAAV